MQGHQVRQGQYDGDLQMFVQVSREPDAGRLQFLRWLAEHGRLEHDVAGPAAGPRAGVSARAAHDEAPLAA